MSGIGDTNAMRTVRRATLAVLSTIALVIVVFQPVTSGAVVGSAFVRVNQVGYPAATSKRAYLMSGVVETGATFAVTNSAGTTVLSGPIGANLGSWSTGFPNVYAIDFDAVTTNGTYSISVTGPVPATSPTFRIDAASNVYAGSLSNALSFYQTERDGPNFIPSALRTAPAHLNDQNAMTYEPPHMNSAGRFSGDLQPLGTTIDASGGWWDAGDYIKGVETLSYATGMMLAGIREFPAQMGSASSTSDFTAEAKFGADWLLRMWDDTTGTLYSQVGIGTGNAKTVGDHDIWRLPQADDTYGGTDPLYRYIRNRPVFRAGAPNSLISPNLAGRDAAALAECYVVYKSSAVSFANQCLTAAEHIFDLANTAPSGNLQTVIPFSFYPETEWRDDLEWGATELYFATQAGSASLPPGLPHTDPSFYLQKAAQWADAYITGP